MFAHKLGDVKTSTKVEPYRYHCGDPNHWSHKCPQITETEISEFLPINNIFQRIRFKVRGFIGG